DIAEQTLTVVRLHLFDLLLEQLDVRAQTRDGRAQLVRGVGDELALRVYGVVERSHRALERIEHRVEAAREPPDLIRADRLDSPAEVLRQRDVLGRLCQALERKHGGAGDEAPEQCS